MPTLAAFDGGRLITYYEKTPGSPVYSFSAGLSRVERTFEVSWNDRVDFVQNMLGFPYITNARNANGANIGAVSRVLPDVLLDFDIPNTKAVPPQSSWLYATSVTRLVGKGETGYLDPEFGIAAYKVAEVTISYEPRTYKILDDASMPTNGTGAPDESSLQRYVTRMQKPTAEFIQLPRGTMAWVDGIRNKDGGVPRTVDYASAKLLASMELVLVWHEVPFVPDAATRFVGCLNRFTFVDSAGDSYLPGTLLLLTAEIKPYRTASGVFVQDITYRFKYFEPEAGRGHNFFYRYLANSNSLVRLKLSHNGLNDGVAILPDNGANGLGPYSTGYTPVAPNVTVTMTPGTGHALYQYAGFQSLFLPQVQTQDQTSY